MKKILGLSACLLAGSANAALITFNGTAGEASVAAVGASYAEGGFTLTRNSANGTVFFFDNDANANLAAWDDDVLEFQSNASAITFTEDDSAPFDFNSAYLGSINSAATIRFEGFFDGGGSIIQNYVAALNSRVLVNFTGFDNLTSLSISAPVDGQFAIMDDFSFTTATVPTPVSLGLLGLGLAGMTLTRKKKTA